MTNMSKDPSDEVRSGGPLSLSALGAHPRGLSRRTLIIGAALVAAAVVAIAIALRPTAPPPTTAATPTPVLTVTAAVPRDVLWPVSVEASGAIVPWQEAVISAQVGGYQIAEVLVNVGDQVTKGQVLARFDKGLLRADEAVLLANHEQADANYKRALGLSEKGFISDQNLLQLETQAKTTAAQLAAKRLQLRYADIVAPDDGAISARNATLGAVANVGQELFRLVRQNRLEWRAELPAAQLTQVEAGQAVALKLPSGDTATAVVRQTAPTLNNDTRLGIAFADLKSGSTARAGMYATGHITIGEQPAQVIPAEAVVLRDGRSYVLELKDTGDFSALALRPVQVGRRIDDAIEIVGGLPAGTRVAVRGSGFLNDGDHVRVVNAPPA